MNLKFNKRLTSIGLGLVFFTLVGCTGTPQGQPGDETVKVQFNLMNGLSASLDVNKGSLIKEPDLTREGYDILGWYTSNDNGDSLNLEWNFFTMGFHYDTTLYAKVDVNFYEIDFVTNIPNETLPIIKQRFGTFLNLPSLARTGYTFAGWFEDDLLTKPFTSNERMPARDFTLFAKWTINQYTITYYDIVEIEKITSISDGDFHSVALSDQGRIFTWGRNTSGQLGVGSLFPQESNVPQIVYPELRPNEVISSISAGSNHTLILTSQSRVLGWGNNQLNQLTSGNISPVLTPTLLTMPSLASNETISKIFAGVNNSFALTSNGRIIAWGDNSSGQFGNGNSISSPSAQIQTLTTSTGALPSNERVIDIAPAATHTIFLNTFKKVYATGSNNQGQLGRGNFTNSNVLTLLSFTMIQNNETIEKIYANTEYSAAVSNLGKVFTWGLNSNSQLGDNTNIRKNTPTLITFTGLTSNDRVTDLNLAINSAYAFTSTGKIFSWGSNEYGQLGSGNFVDRLIPQTINVSSIKGSLIQMDASPVGLRILTDQGFIFGFGLNDYGQMGWGLIGGTSLSLTETTIKSYLNTNLVKLNETALNFNQNIVLVTAPTKQGHTFSGWFMDYQFSVPFSPNRMGTSNFSVFAKWTKN